MITTLRRWLADYFQENWMQDVCYFLALLSIGAGFTLFSNLGTGLIIVGMLLLLTIRPIRSWWGK